MTKTPDTPGGSLTRTLSRLGLRAAPERQDAAEIFISTLENLERKARRSPQVKKKGSPCR